MQEFDKEKFWNEWRTRNRNVYEDLEHCNKAHCYDENIRVLQNHANSYALNTIKFIFYINGGALISMPPLIAAFNLPQGVNIWLCGLSFAIALCFIVITGLLAYWSCIAMIYHIDEEKFSRYNGFFITEMDGFLSDKEFISSLKSEKEATQARSKKYHKRSVRLEIIAIVFGILSLISFLTGISGMTYIVLKQDLNLPIIQQPRASDPGSGQ